MSKDRISIMGFAVLFSFVALKAMAGEEPTSTFPKPQEVPGTLRPTVGALIGYADQNGPVKAAPIWGADFQIQPIVPFSVGMEVTHFQGKLGDLPSGSSHAFNRTAFLLTGAYNLGGTTPVIKNTYIGFKVGAVLDTESTDGPGTPLVNQSNRARFAFAPEIGMDFMVAEHISVGPHFSYLFTVGPESPYNTVEALASAKYWF